MIRPETTRTDRAQAAILGALTADAAALGLHWLYDPERIATLDPVAFRDPDPEDFADAKGVFVHHGKRAGDGSHYAALLRVAMQALAEGAEVFDPADMQSRLEETFGYGGTWAGYVDRPVRGTLANLAADRRAPSGVEDDQLPALAALIPLLARPQGARTAEIDAAVAVTNLGDPARDWSRAFARMLAAALDGAGMADALEAGEENAAPVVADALAAARTSLHPDPVAFAGEVGRACHLHQGLPVVAHILHRTPDFAEAVQANIRVGGDSCGRALPLGALLGATGALPPPLWLLRLRDGETLAAEIAAVTLP